MGAIETIESYCSIKHSRWRSIIITLTVDPGTSRYIIQLHAKRKQKNIWPPKISLNVLLALSNDSETNKRES